MDAFDTAGTAPDKSGEARLFSSPLGFTRSLFTGKNGRTHTESRCNQCSFRIRATTADTLDDQEREHADACQGSQED